MITSFDPCYEILLLPAYRSACSCEITTHRGTCQHFHNFIFIIIIIIIIIYLDCKWVCTRWQWSTITHTTQNNTPHSKKHTTQNCKNNKGHTAHNKYNYNTNTITNTIHTQIQYKYNLPVSVNTLCSHSLTNHMYFSAHQGNTTKEGFTLVIPHRNV
jgi:hypothetical protein